MNTLIRLFEQRVRGIRLIELIGLTLALGMIFWVCLSKARNDSDIRQMNQIDQQIADQQEAVDTLKVKVASLERPARLEALATAYLGMKPVSPTHEVALDTIGEISHTVSRPVQAAATVPVTAPTPVAAAAPAGGDDLISTAPAQKAATAQKAGGKL